MALSNIEGGTIGGLDEGRGSSARILAFNGVVTLGTNVTGTCVHSVTQDGAVTDTNAGSATHALAVTFGKGLTLETPAITDDDEATFKLTFGVVSTSAVTADSQQLNIQVAQVNVGLLDKTADDFLPLPAAVKSVSGNQIQFSIGELNVNGADVVIAANDAFHINVIAYAFPAN